MTSPAPTPSAVGDLLREWRHRRGLSQIDLAGDAKISTRHLSFVETGRSSPSRDVLLRLAERLDMSLRARNHLLNAAGLASACPERRFDDPALGVARRTVESILAAHAPYPALAVDRYWTLLGGNSAVSPLLTGVAAALLAPPVNVLRLSLHPEGLAPRIDNLGEWRRHLLTRLRQQIDQSGDERLTILHDELTAYPSRASTTPAADLASIAVPLRLRVPGLREALSLISMTMVFGTPVDVTLSELAIESFFPADEPTRAALHSIASAEGLR